MEEILIFATVISAVTLGLVQVVKKTEKVPKNIIPMIGILIGATVGGSTELIPELLSELSLGGRIFAGVVSGLMATGVWESFKKREGDYTHNENI